MSFHCYAQYSISSFVTQHLTRGLQHLELKCCKCKAFLYAKFTKWKKYKPSLRFSLSHSFRSPYFLTPFGFEIVALLCVVIALVTLLVHFSFVSIFVIVEVNIECILDDNTITTVRLNEKIKQDRLLSVENDLKHLVDLHLHLYK